MREPESGEEDALAILIADRDAGRADRLRGLCAAEFPGAFLLLVDDLESVRAVVSDAAWNLVVAGIADADEGTCLTALAGLVGDVPVLAVTENFPPAQMAALLAGGATEVCDLARGGAALLPYGARRAIERARSRQRNAELETRLAQAEHVASLNALMAGIAHNLNNPLTSVQAFLDLLPERWDSDSEFRGEFFSLVRGEMLRIRSLIASMMQAVAVPAGGAQEPWALAELKGELESRVRAGEGGRSLCLDFRIDDGLPRLVAAREAVRQALIILLDNAVAFSPAGGAVRLEARVDSRGGAEALSIEVADEGPGIPLEHRSRVFEAFFSTRSGGLGIGLFVARSVARVHGGALELCEDGGPGARIRLELPARAPAI